MSFRSSRRAPPEAQPENGTTTFCISNRHAASHLLDQRLHHRQPDATTRDLGAVAATAETLKHQLPLLPGDSRAMVANLQDQPLCLAETVNLHRRSRRAIPAGVVKQIDQTLHNSITISTSPAGNSCLL